jgi:hypothetical protein
VEPAVELDILDADWELTVDTHLNRVPKACILEAVGGRIASQAKVL